MNQTFNPTKLVQTRSGLRVILYCTDAPGDWPVHGRICFESNRSTLRGWTCEGKIYLGDREDEEDLINTPEVVEGWTNVYLGPDPGPSYSVRYIFHPSKEKADNDAFASRIACVPIKFTVGEGIS